MRVIAFVIASAIVALGGPSACAATWETALVQPYRPLSLDVVAASDGGVFVLDSHNVTKLDGSGSLLWSRRLEVSDPDRQSLDYVAVAATHDGGLLLGGQYFFFSGGPTAIVTELDASGSKVAEYSFIQDYTMPYGSHILSVIETAAGDVVTASEGLDPDTGLTTPLVLCMRSFVRLWNFRYPGPSAGFLMDIVEIPGGGFLAVGSASPDALALRLDPLGGVVWQKSYSVGSRAFLSSIALLPTGGALLGGLLFETYNQWLLEIDADGEPVASREVLAPMSTSPGGLRGLADGSTFVSGGRHSGFVARLDPYGGPVWAKELPHANRLFAPAPAADSGVVIAFEQAGRFVISKLDAAGDVEPDTCGFREPSTWSERALPVVVMPLPETSAETMEVLMPGHSVVEIVYPEHGEACSCSFTVAPVSKLRSTKVGDDVELRFDISSGALAYNAWTVDDRRLINQARQASAPPAVGVVGCSPPASAPIESCLDAGAIRRDSPGVFYYQVRGVCDATTEGP